MFHDPDLQRRYERDGYVTVQLLDDEALDAVRAVRHDNGDAPGDPRTGLFNDTWSTDRSYKRRVSSALHEHLDGPVDELLVDHRILGFVHIVKWPGESGRVPAHRDPTFVDEQHHRSVAIWCALEDLGPADGPLRVVPGSHLLDSGVRVHQAEHNLYPHVDEHADELSVPVPLSAGEAIVYDHRLIHLSDATEREHERTVIAGIMAPRDAEAVYSMNGPDGAVTVAIGPDFFLDHQLDALDVDEVLASTRRTAPEPGAVPDISLRQLRSLQRRRRRT